MSGKPVIVKVYINTDRDSWTDEVEIPRTEWDSMSAEERVSAAEGSAEDCFFNACNYGHEVIE